MPDVNILLGEDFDRKPEVQPSVVSRSTTTTILSFYDSSKDTLVQFFKNELGVCQFFMKKTGLHERYAGEISMGPAIGNPTYIGPTQDGIGVRFLVDGQEYTISVVDNETARQKWLQHRPILISLMPNPLRFDF